MTRLNWGASGERYYETGVDRGVLYIDDVGVPWNGLTAVNESPSGGEPTPYYIDGVKFRNLSAVEEYEATIEALSSPPEFAPCIGLASIHNGLFVSDQPRESFGFSYRTLVGNDVDDLDHGYKIHLVYGALASPSTRENATIGDSPEPTGFSWSISAMPPPLANYRPSAHFIIDSRTTDPILLQDLEDILYGSDDLVASLPTPTELVALFTAPQYTVSWVGATDNSVSELYNGRTGVLLRRNIALDPRTPSGGSGGTGSVSSTATPADTRFETDICAERSWTTGPSADALTHTTSTENLVGVANVGDIYLVQGRYALTGTLQTGSIIIRFSGSNQPTVLSSGSVDHGDGTITVWRVLQWAVNVSSQPGVSLVARPSNGAVIRASDYLVERLDSAISGPLPFFCGSVLPS